MKRAPDSLPVKVSIVVFLTLALFVSVVRPLTRPTGHLYARFGLTRMSLLAESADDTDGAALQPADATVVLLHPLVAISVLLLVLKMRRVAFHPVRVRRVKRPPRRTAGSLISDQR